MGVEELFKAVGCKYFDQNFNDNNNNPSYNNNNQPETKPLSKSDTLKLDKNMFKNDDKNKTKCCYYY